MLSVDSFQTFDQFSYNEKKYNFYNLTKLENSFPKTKNLPKSKKILIENLLRLEDGKDVNKALIENVLENPEKKHEIFFLPSREY
tara:strand:+ start:20 stop:274 length:255 start_codon:yes stop_codon:yes gene_type:complete